MLRLVLLALFVSPLTGCYYMQAAQGQWELTRKREPINKVLQDEATSTELSERLRLIQDARRFSIDELMLPDNNSYTTYADIERDYVVWNVFAAPEFSMQAKTWCFPVAGCVSYRGYFSKDAAEHQAARLAAKGYDVAIGGVAAYSTLGKLNDPVVSSMMNWDDTQLVAVLFHELAHQVLYVKGDSGFNESFATAVEEFGVRRWLSLRREAAELDEYIGNREKKRSIMARVAVARDELADIYKSEITDAAKREQKRVRLEQLRTQVGWKNGELNNARLASMTLYEGRLPEFRALFESCDQQIRCFYDKARALAGR